MELILILIVFAGLVYWFGFRQAKTAPTTQTTSNKVESTEVTTQPSWHTAPAEGSPLATNVLDVNQDGKVNLEDVKEAVKKTRTRVKKAADVNGDGKVTAKDVKAAAKKVTKVRKPRSQKA